MVAFFSPAPIMAVSLSFTFVASAVSSTHQIIIPASAAVGDLAYLVDAQLGSSNNFAPTGWTSVSNADGDDLRVIHSYKVLIGGDPGSTISGMNGTTDQKIMLVFRPSGVIASVTASTYNSQVTAGNPSSQNVAASGQPPPLIVFGSGAGTFVPAFSVASPAFDDTITQGDLIVGYKVYNTAPADHTIDVNDIGADNALQSGYLRFT